MDALQREPITMATQRQSVAPFDLVVFGGTGDLAFRKLLPALYLRHRDGQIPADSRIIGAARAAVSNDHYREQVAAALAAHLPTAVRDKAAVQAFLERLSFVALDALSGAGWQDLAWVLATGSSRIRVFYLAVAPNLIEGICHRLAGQGLVTPATRVVVEKSEEHTSELQSRFGIPYAVFCFEK